MTAFGERLKAAREAKGATLETVSRATRISKPYLDALERSDLAALPGRVFAKGYIKSYAEFLGMDDEPLLEGYALEERRLNGGAPDDAQRQLDELSQLIHNRSPDAHRSFGIDPRHLAIGIGVVVMVFAVAVWVLVFRDASVEPPPEAEVPVTVKRSLRSPDPEPAEDVEPDPADEAPVEEAPLVPARRTLRVTQSGAGADIVDRNLVGRSDRFPEGSRVHFWTRVVGGEDGDRIWHVWTHAGGTFVRADLRVGGEHWRTYSSFVLPPGSAGEWVLEAKDANGAVLARETFVCVSREGT